MKMLTVAGSAVQLTDGGYTFSNISRYVTLDVQDADVFVTYTGETPSGTVGHRLYAGRSYTWSVNSANAAKFIRTGSTSAVIAASQFTD
tara:strand:- start:553 stop:819 length:267 start_codon:yes stop_codon:yes gene_type:complete